jgi:hypothetical protein
MVHGDFKKSIIYEEGKRFTPIQTAIGIVQEPYSKKDKFFLKSGNVPLRYNAVDPRTKGYTYQKDTTAYNQIQEFTGETERRLRNDVYSDGYPRNKSITESALSRAQAVERSQAMEKEIETLNAIINSFASGPYSDSLKAKHQEELKVKEKALLDFYESHLPEKLRSKEDQKVENPSQMISDELKLTDSEILDKIPSKVKDEIKAELKQDDGNDPSLEYFDDNGLMTPAGENMRAKLARTFFQENLLATAKKGVAKKLFTTPPSTPKKGGRPSLSEQEQKYAEMYEMDQRGELSAENVAKKYGGAKSSATKLIKTQKEYIVKMEKIAELEAEGKLDIENVKRVTGAKTDIGAKTLMDQYPRSPVKTRSKTAAAATPGV